MPELLRATSQLPAEILLKTCQEALSDPHRHYSYADDWRVGQAGPNAIRFDIHGGKSAGSWFVVEIVSSPSGGTSLVVAEYEYQPGGFLMRGFDKVTRAVDDIATQLYSLPHTEVKRGRE